MKPFVDRTKAQDSVFAGIGRVFGGAQAIRTANVFAFNIPPIIGLGTGGTLSCENNNRATINVGRWLQGAEAYGDDLADVLERARHAAAWFRGDLGDESE